MVDKRSGHAHQQVALIFGVPAGVLTAAPMVPFDWYRAPWLFVGVPVLVVCLLTVGWLGHRFDQIDAEATSGLALLRLAAPFLATSVGTTGAVIGALAMRPGGLEDDFWLGRGVVAVVAIFVISPMIAILAPLFDVGPVMDPQRGQNSQLLPLLMIVGSKHLAATGSPGAFAARSLPILHRTISSMIVLAWIPAGVLVVLLFVVCPTKGDSVRSWTVPLSFVLLQMVGNTIGGWVLDRHRGRGARLSACFLACGLVSIGVIATGLLGLQVADLIDPPGPSQNCFN